MPRRPRYYIPGIACHVIQRGNNRQPCFFRLGDYQRYLDWLGEASLRYGCEVHAYVLMTNHVHLLVTPRTEEAISRTMQSLGRRYVQFVNVRESRTGTLWEGRHRACLVQSERYLLTCYRYIEMNPVRAGMVQRVADYPFSSYHGNALGRADALVRPHPVYSALSSDSADRCSEYRRMFVDELDPDSLRFIRDTTNAGVPLGDPGFRDDVDRQLSRPISYREGGRPRAK